MYRLLFLAWLFFCLALTVEGAPLYVTGQLKPWTTATPDFARTGASADTGANYYGPLDFFSRPTLTGSPTSVATSPATFPSWYGVFSDQPSVRPYTITFQENAGVYKFERTNFYPSLDNANNNYRWTYHFRIQTSSSVTGLFVTSTDEVAVYNNGILLAQNSGYSSTPRTTPTQSTAGASVLDFFTAHRSQDVTPQLTIQFSFSGAATCNAFSESQLTPFDVFTPSRIQTIGTGRVTGTAAAPVVEVMQAASKSAIGGVYPDVKFRVSNGFSTYFKFQYTGGQTVGSEGFAFVVQGYGLSTLAAQGGGEKLGYNFPNNLAVEFDTKQSTPTTGYGTIQTFDADGNHVEIHSSFSSASPASPTTPDSACAQCNSVINSLGTTNGAKPLPILTSGTLEVYIEYVPGTMTIWVDPSLSTQSYGFRSSSWVRRAPVTHSDFTNLFGSNPNQALAYMGFTSASNSVNSTNIQISEWKVWTVPVSATTTTQTPVYNPGWVADIARDRKAPTGANLKLQLVDGCGLPVNTPYDSVVATLVGPGNPMTEVNQNADGTWNVYYYNTLVGQNTLQLKVNEQTIIANGTTFSDVYNYVFIYPAPISTNNSYFVPDRVALAARTWRATDLLDVQVYARDAFNNANPMPGGNFRIFFSQQAQIAPSSQTGNMYNFTIGTNLAAPNIKIAVWYNGADILGSPTDAFEVLSGIYPDPVNTARTLTSDITTYKTVQYYGLIQAVAGQTGSFTVQFRDQYDNVIKEPALVVPGNVSLSIGCISSGVVDSRCNPNPATVNAVQIGGPLLRITYGSQVASQYQINITLAKTSAAGNPSALLPTQPTPSIVPDTEFPNMTIATFGNFSSGTQGSFVLQARDIYGNNRTQPSTPGQFLIDIDTLTVTCVNTGTGTPVNGTKVLSATCVYTQTGQYVVTFTPVLKTVLPAVVKGTCGTPACATPTFNLNVASGPPYPPLDNITIGATVVAGNLLPFTLTSVDAQSNLRPMNADNGLYVVSGKLPDNSAGAAIGTVQGVSDGLYSSNFNATVKGNYTVEVKMLGQSIRNSPQYVLVTPSATDLGKSTVSGAGVNGGVALSSAYFILNAIDKWGNSNSGPNYVQDVFSSCTLNASATPCNVVSIGGAGSGIYNVSYTVPTNSPVATFTLTITDTPVGYPQTSRTFLMYSTDTNAVSWATIHKTQADNVCTVTLTAADEYPAGVESSIWLKDRNDGPPTCTPKPNPTNLPSWVLDFVTGPQPFKGSATLVTPGVYNVSFVGTKLGIYDLQVFNGGTQTEQSKAPGIKLTIVPGPLDPLSCTVVGFPVTLVAGTQGSYQVTLRDNQGNMLRNANGVNLIPKLSGTSIPNPAWTFNVIPTAGSPVVNITYVPTVATVDGGTMTIATDAQGQALPRIAGRDFVVVVTAAAVDPKFSCFYQSNSGLAPTCPVSALAAQGTAGDVYTADLYPRDVYGNVITDPATPFTVTLDSNPGMTSTASFVGNGHWKVQFTPTKVTTGGTLRAFSGATQVASATMTVNPSVLDPDHSWITGLKTNYTAGDTVAFTLNGRDRFDNMVPNAIIDISGSGPLLLKKGLGAADIKAVNSIPVTGGAYDFTYLATRASTQNLSNILPYTLAWKSSGVLVRINSSNDVVNGTNQFFVYPAVPYAPNTQLPFLTSSKIPAGSGPTLKLQLRDQYLNLVRVGGASLTTDFYAGETPTCDQGGNNITDPDVVSNFSTPYFSDSGDGTYLALINQTKAGKYYASFKVEGQPIKVCNALTTLFEITPLVADGPHSLLVGPAVDNPNSNVAGTPISFMVILRDKYDNPVIPDPTYNITVNGPATPDICPTTLNYLNRPKQNITDYENGSYSVNFEAQKAETFALVVLVNGTQVSTTCRNLTIRPWYVARFNQTSGMGTLSAAQPASVEIQGFDKFDNLVTGGKHSWSLLVTRTTEDGLDDYVFRISSAYLGSDFTKQIAPYVAHWAGAYVAVTHLQQDPDFISVAPPVADQDFNFTVLEATCAGRDPTRPKLCADRSCADTWANCPAAAGTVWCGGGTAAANAGACASRCPASQSLCRSAFNPYCAAGTCAGPVSDIVPSWATITCANGGFPRQSAADCPTNNRVCPPGYPMCPDGHSCAASFSECNTALTACPAGMSMCYTGRCVSSASDCPTEVSCPNLSDVVCPDGSCQASADACSAPLPCYAPNDKRCSDGSCRSSFADCPSQVTCQPGFAKCQTGHCVRSVSECAAYIKKCNETMTRCADGTCRPNTLLCSSQVTCPSTMPVLCADGSCVAAVGLCRQYEMCSNATEPYMCANGLCASTMASCPTVATCTNEYSVLCSDRTCKASATGCIAKVCSVNRPFYCVDGSCGASMADCPAGAACPAGSPVRCSTGSCVPASNMCPQPVCSAGFVACANGGCATSRSECGTSMTCAWNSTRCADGSCRADCTDVTRDPSSYCKPTSSSDSFFCPSQEAGFGCAASAADCATSVTCPSDRPVRCADRSCAVSYEYCKTAPSYVPGIKTCPANTFSQDGGSCNPSTTCPLMFPVKCWDETCRKVSKDCPPETKCAQDSNDPSQVRPYLCPDGTCARNIYECIPTKQCPPGQGTVKCPLPAGGIICADSIDECPSLMNNSLGLSCPDDKQRCKNGACASTCRDADYACPHYVPIRCQNGKCVERATECPTNATAGCYPGQTRCQDGSCRQSCSGVEKPTCGQTLCTDGICRANCDGFSATGCPGGGVWCQDGSCSTEQRPCTNPGFQSQTTASNACPAWRPFRCPSGFCAMSSSLCPVPAQEKVCVSGYPVLCADGTCQRTHAQCAVIQACPGGYQRCNSSICVPATATCPPWKLCPGNQVMCWNGLCAADTASCINETTGCPGNLNKCPDGLCSSTACSDIPTGTGCASGQVKCYDGTCAAAGACSNPPGYNRADPASLPYAPTSRGSTTVWNCPVATPVRCADSTCKKYAADGSQDAETCASGVVVCPAERPHVCLDGSCVAVANHCPSFLPCASGQVRCPNDLACVGALTDCAKLTCPAGSPSLCPDGSCRRSRRECGRQMGYECEGTTPFRCFDGSCANSPAVCQQGRDCTGASMCWDGSCQKTPNYGNGDMNKYLWLHCPPVPACPGNTYGLRCWDGTCVNKTADCPATATCPSGQRCADGACRPSCPLYNGCYGSTPLYCPGAIVQCKAASDTCPIKPEVCGEDCNRDYQVQNQIVSIPAAAPVVVDVSLDSDNAPHTRLEIASGSFGTSTMLTIWGRTFATLEGYRVRYPDGSLIPKTPSQALLSSPFMCSVNSASSTSFSLNISVLASMDRRVFFTASEEENQKLKVPCDLIKEYSGLPEENGVGCLRAIAVNETWMSVKQSQTTQCSNIEYNGTISNITQVESAAGQATCVCINVTGGLNGNANPTVPKDTKVCLTILQKSALSGTGGTVFYQDSTSLGSCVDVTATSLSAVSLTPTSTTDGCASTTDARVIQVKDICLAYLDLPNTQFKCIDDYGTRISRPVWFPDSGLPASVALGRLTQCRTDRVYAIMNIPQPLPPAAANTGESWWAKYGKIVLGVGISMFILLLILAYAISRLVRYRRKYLEEKEEAEELRSEAKDLDEKHGGLGVYDDEVEMIANPLVVEMQQLQVQLDETNKMLETQKEMDERQMSQLDKERQRIKEEIDRVKAAIAAQKQKDAARVEDVPSTTPGTTTSVTSSGTKTSAGSSERQDFTGSGAPRRKHKDL